jgi:hypothetical protein
MLSTHQRLRLPIGLFLSVFSTNNLHALFFSHIRSTCSVHIIYLDSSFLIILGEGCKSRSSSLCIYQFLYVNFVPSVI